MNPNLNELFAPFYRSYWKQRRQEQMQRREMVRFYSLFIREGDLCFDVGANVGNRTEAFLELGAKIVVVEPQECCIRQMRKKFGGNPNIVFVEKALGDRLGRQEIMISDANTISSVSKEWIESVKASGRFPEYRWDTVVPVTVTTLDELIREYGIPSFIKIDVEGFEYQVLKGLSQPVKMLSFEFVPEIIERAVNCIGHLATLGLMTVNYSLGESMQLALREWVSPAELARVLTTLPDKSVFGDVYVRFV